MAQMHYLFMNVFLNKKVIFMAFTNNPVMLSAKKKTTQILKKHKQLGWKNKRDW